jgi:hypothetical protein
LEQLRETDEVEGVVEEALAAHRNFIFWGKGAFLRKRGHPFVPSSLLFQQ